jgi:hypothetical protein
MKKALIRFYKRFKVYLGKIKRSSVMKTHEELELHEKTAFKICVNLFHMRIPFLPSRPLQIRDIF